MSIFSPMKFRAACRNVVALFFTVVLLASCQNIQTSTVEKTPSLKNYVSLDLAYATYSEKLQKLEKQIQKSLKNRGEAHITLITPPEYNHLRQRLSDIEIHEQAKLFLKSPPRFKEFCIGSGETSINQKKETTYYVVVESSDFIAFRKKLAQLSQLPVTEFNPDLFYPHITLGFTSRDLHYEDGVIKNKQSCLKDQPL